MQIKHKLTTALLLGSIVCLISSTAFAKPTGIAKEQACYNAGETAYLVTTRKDEQKAIGHLDTAIKENQNSPAVSAYFMMVKELSYYGLNKQGVFQGDRLKQLIRSKCLSIHGDYFKE